VLGERQSPAGTNDVPYRNDCIHPQGCCSPIFSFAIFGGGHDMYAACIFVSHEAEYAPPGLGRKLENGLPYSN
jgi:hypothetical protein